MADTYLEKLLGDREQVQYIARQHWIMLARNILAEILIIVLILAAVILVLLFYPGIPSWAAVLLGFAVLLLPLFSMTRDILNYNNNQYVITTRRVIHVKGILDKATTDSSLEKVNDVHMTQTAMGRMFNYGDVEILTASELGVNNFKNIYDPVRFKTAMLNSKQSLEDRDDFPQQMIHPGPSEDIPELLAKLGALRQQGVLTEEEFQIKKAQLLGRL